MRDTRPSSTRSGALAAFALASVIALFVLSLGVVGPGRVQAFLSGWVFNACTVFALLVPFVLASRMRLPALVLAPFHLLVLGACVLVFAHAWYFDVAIERRLTLLDLTVDGVAHFFGSALSSCGLVTLVLLLVAIALGTWGLSRVRGVARAVVAPVGFVTFTALPWALATERVASPLYDSAQELWEIAASPAVVASRAAVDEAWLAGLDASARTRGTPPVRFSRVVVIVMETMTAATFASESAALGSGTFVKRERAHVHAFERYYANNQDSRTGMLAMLFSRVIPYEAYSEAGYAAYRGLAQVPSLVDRMQALGFESAFVLAQTALEEVVTDLAWDARIHLSDARIAEARRAGKLCFTPDEYERSCEDLVLLPDVLDFLASRERAFVYQEMIWGHAVQYNEASGLSNAAYYSAYLDALLAGLRERGLADDTLIALTADHGYRDKGRQADPAVYQLPLWLHAARFLRANDRRLLSHVDFGLLLLEALTDGARADDHRMVLAVGPTGQGNLFAVGRSGGHLLLRHKAGSDLLIAQDGALELAPGEVLAAFRAYRARFDRDVARAR